MAKTPDYNRPKIQTVPASQIVELMGPVSCGSYRPCKATNDILAGRSN